MQVVGFEMLAIGARFEWGGLVKPQQPHSVGSEVKGCGGEDKRNGNY